MTMPDDATDLLPMAEPEPTPHRHDKTPVESLKVPIYILAGSVIVLCVLAALLLTAYRGKAHDASQANDRAATQSGKNNALGTALATANSAIVSLGGTPVATPTSAAPAPTATVTVTGPRGSAGSQGETGSPGVLSQQQVLAALAVYCTVNICPVTLTPAEVAAAVSAYCKANGCGITGPAGPTGATGATGPPGVSGQVGATGPNGADGPTGPAGPSGASGASGAPGSDGPTGPPIDHFGFKFSDDGGLTMHSFVCSLPDYDCTEVGN